MQGELWGSPGDYRKDGCFFCKYFTSYAYNYDDDMEPDDCGFCGVTGKLEVETPDGEVVAHYSTCKNFVGRLCG